MEKDFIQKLGAIIRTQNNISSFAVKKNNIIDEYELDQFSFGSGGGGGGDYANTIEYGKLALTFPGIDYPLVNVSRGASNSNLDLYHNFPNYSDCQWEITVIDSGDSIINVYPPQYFETTDAITAWVNANVEHTTTFSHTAIARVFDIEDPKIVKPAKIYGKNGVLSRIRPDGANYYSSLRRSITAEIRWDPAELDNMLRAAWLHLFNHTIPTFTANMRSCFWTSKSSKTMYNCALDGLRIYIPTPGYNGRYGFNTGTGLPFIAPSPWVISERYLTYGEPAYIEITPDGNYYDIYGSNTVHNKIPESLGRGSSIIIAIPIEQMGTTDTQAVLLKPLGVDQLFPSYFDMAIYEMEAVGGYKMDGTLRIRKMGDPRVGSSPRQRAIGPYCGDSWFAASGTTKASESTSTSTFPGNIYFRLRNKVTKRVSSVSNTYIGWKTHLRAVPLAAIIKHRLP